MKQTTLPISRCNANCTKCGMPADFKMFESGAGGDFATYTGLKTYAIYRVDLGKIHYLKKTLSDLLAPAIAHEGSESSLREIPMQVHCHLCDNVFHAQNSTISGEERVDAYEL